MNAQFGRILGGDAAILARSYERFSAQPVDLDRRAGADFSLGRFQTTIRAPSSVTGPGTFFGKAVRKLTFEPSSSEGWWLRRDDLPDSLPIRVSVNNVWTTARNIVLLSGSPHNYVRMVEHIVALRLGLALDNVVIRLESGDPPLFERGSMDLVEAVDSKGIVETARKVPYVTVKEPVALVADNGAFLVVRPPAAGALRLDLDCAVDFPSAIGRQRLQMTVTPDVFRYGALARTNTTFAMMLYVKTIGKLFADVRHLGYSPRNILIAGRRRYFNEAKMVHNGKSLEAVWHRATLDLLAAISLADTGRFVGEVLSYKAGHALDVVLIRKLYEQDLLQPLV